MLVNRLLLHVFLCVSSPSCMHAQVAKSHVCLDHSVYLEMPFRHVETKQKLQHYNGSSSDCVILFVSRLQNARKDQETSCSLIPRI